jgi:hypothetical protein
MGHNLLCCVLKKGGLSSRTVFLYRWDTWNTTHSVAFCSKEADQLELYLYIGGTHGTQLTLLLFVVKSQI